MPYSCPVPYDTADCWAAAAEALPLLFSYQLGVGLLPAPVCGAWPQGWATEACW